MRELWVPLVENPHDCNHIFPSLNRLEHRERFNKAATKFAERMKTTEPKKSKAELEAKAEKVKAEGNAAISAKDYEKAAASYQEAVKLSPDGPNSHIYFSNLAAALLHLQRFEEAIDACNSAIEINPEYPKAYSRHGTAHMELGEYEQAAASFQQVLRIDPGNKPATASLKQAQSKLVSVQLAPVVRRFLTA